MVGTAGANQLVGAAGDDLIFGAGGDDTIRWNLNDGRDFVDGGAGNDRLWLASPDGVVVYETIAAARAAFPTETFRTDTEKVVARNGVVIAELKNVEQVVFNTPPSLQLNGFDSVTHTWGDNFNTATFTNNNAGTTNSFGSAWVEANDTGGATGGSVRITGGTGGTLTFSQGNADNASVTRTLDLAGASSATVTFSVADTGVTFIPLIGDDEQLLFEFAADGINFVTLETFNGNNGGNISVTLPTDVPFSADAAIRFRANNTLDPAGFLQAAESFSVDNLTISAVFPEPAASPSIDITTSYVENAAATPIASEPLITDDAPPLASARIVLTNAFAADQLVVPVAALAAQGIAAVTQTVGATIVVTLAGTASTAAYQAAIQSIGYRNTSEDPDPTPRVIEVSVNDGLLNSNVARTTVNVTPVDDLVNANNDTVISNSQTLPIVIPNWALLANDVDPDDPISLTAAGPGTGITAALTGESVTVSADAGPALGGTFNYTATGGLGSDTASVTLQRPAAPALNITGGNGSEIIVADNRNSIITANGGNDIIFTGAGNDVVTAGTGDDTMVWNVGDGSDRFDGGTDVTEDTVRVDGNAEDEAFVVYSRAAAIAAGIVGLNGATEIVITRNGTVITELDNVEEILINTGDGTDSVTTQGNFAPTSLSFNTITINGGAGDDTVDISGLQSAHRIVFRSNGGNDTIVGTLRPQDVVELASGQDLTTYTLVDNGNGTKSFTNGTHSITFTGAVPPQFGGDSTPDDDAIDGAFEYTPSDVEGLEALVRGQKPAFVAMMMSPLAIATSPATATTKARGTRTGAPPTRPSSA